MPPSVPPWPTRWAALTLCLLAPVVANAQGWVGPLSRLELAPREADSSLEQRVAAARRLGRHGEREGAVTALLAALARRPPEAIERQLLLSLARRASPRAVEPTISLLQARRGAPPEAFLVLAATATGPAIEALIDALGTPSRSLAAARALRRVGASAVPALLRALEGPAPAQAIVLLGELGDPRALMPLLGLLEDDQPQLAVLAAKSLGQLGESGAAEPLAGVLAAGEAPLVQAALSALATVAGPDQAAPLLAHLARNVADPPTLRALCRASPAHCVEPLGQALARAPPELKARLTSILLDQPQPEYLPLLVAQLGPTGRGAAVASAISGLPAGLAALLERMQEHPEWAPELARPLAIGLRSQPDLPPALRHRALSRLRALPEGPRQLWLRGLARDSELGAGLVAALASQDPSLRAAAALAGQWLGEAAPRGALCDALERELSSDGDPETLRRLADAALRLQLDVEPRAVLDPSELTHPTHSAGQTRRAASLPERLLLAARPGPQPQPTLIRALARALRPGPGSHARLRASAALSLGRLGRPLGRFALGRALEDPSPVVRLAAARALALLGRPHTAVWLRSRARVEPELALSATLMKLARTLSARRPPPMLLGGQRVLEVRLLADSLPVQVELIGADGHWSSQRSLPSGELLVADLPPEEVVVRPVPTR